MLKHLPLSTLLGLLTITFIGACSASTAPVLSDTVASQIHIAVLSASETIFVATPNSATKFFYCTAEKAEDLNSSCGNEQTDFKELSNPHKKPSLSVYDTSVVAKNGLAVAFYAMVDQKKTDSRTIVFQSKGSQNTGSFKDCDATAQELLVLHNNERRRVNPRADLLVLNDKLCKAAMDYTAHLVSIGFVYVQGVNDPHSVDSSLSGRIQAAGYRGMMFGENYAQAASAADATQMWIESTPHHNNMVSQQYTEVGFGVGGNGNNIHWVANFGAPAP